MSTDYLLQDLTRQVIGVFYIVYSELGYGFLEKVYHNAMLIELGKRGFRCESQKKISVYYSLSQVGEYYADILVNDKIILELKAAEVLAPDHEQQLINYLRATKIEVGLLLNFGKKPEIRRKIFTNDRKKNLSV